MFIEYKNSLGSVIMQGNSASLLRVSAVEGLGIAQREYTTAVFAGYDGQETVGSRVLPRCITISAEICGKDISAQLHSALRVLSAPGYLYLGDKGAKWRIFCNQTKIPDPVRVLKGRISTLAVQFVCDNPYFQDATETNVALYKRTKELSSPFTLPGVLGTSTTGTELFNKGDISAEPIISIICPMALDSAESVVISNLTTGKKLRFSCTPGEGEKIVIDIPNRKIYGSISGNMLGFLSDDSFIGDFVLAPGVNVISAVVGDVASGFTVECTYNNLYYEAVIA